MTRKNDELGSILKALMTLRQNTNLIIIKN